VRIEAAPRIAPEGDDPRRRPSFSGHGDDTGLGLEQIVIDVKRWLYDRGPGQFTRVLTFRNGYVDTIALAGYGEL
jgi:hypothetical protein